DKAQLEIAECLAALRRRQGTPRGQGDVIRDPADAAIAQQHHHASRVEAACPKRDSLGVPTRRGWYARRPQDRKAHPLTEFVGYSAVRGLVVVIERAFRI